MLDSCFSDEATGLTDFGVTAFAGMTDSLAKVAGAEEEHVDTPRRRNGVEVLDRLGVFDLYGHEAFFVGLRQIATHVGHGESAVRVTPVKSSSPDGVKLGLACDLSSLLAT